MNTLYFDSIGGASGDMIMASLIDLGVDADHLQRGLESLPVEPFRIIAEPVVRQGLRGVTVSVVLDTAHEHGATHRHGHHHPPHRGLRDIRALIDQSALPDPVRRKAIQVFERLAEAEARVHGSTPDDVHFHEVGAVDSIVDIVGGCLALHRLAVEKVAFSPLPIGHGTVETAHGIMPLPAPATVELLKDCRVIAVNETNELVTPTGAALLTTWGANGDLPADARLKSCGYGFGQRMLTGRPNALRAMLIESPTPDHQAEDACLVLECNLDDTSPEWIGALVPRLLEAGALDVFTTAIQMKKQRPGTLVTVLCRPESRDTLLHIIFTESTTFGVREYLTRRTVLNREIHPVETPYGVIRVKFGRWKGAIITRSPEYDDCLARAKEKQAPLRAVYEAARKAAEQL